MKIPNFRIWNTDTKEMHDVHEMTHPTLMHKGIFLPSDIPNIKYMMSTGSFDKNSKEIFEGDIIQIQNDKFVVYWNDQDKKMQLNKLSIDGIVLNIAPLYIEDDIEIIGNCLQNPEEGSLNMETLISRPFCGSEVSDKINDTNTSNRILYRSKIDGFITAREIMANCTSQQLPSYVCRICLCYPCQCNKTPVKIKHKVLYPCSEQCATDHVKEFGKNCKLKSMAKK